MSSDLSLSRIQEPLSQWHGEYVIDIPLQGNKTFESFLMYVHTPDVA